MEASTILFDKVYGGQKSRRGPGPTVMASSRDIYARWGVQNKELMGRSHLMPLMVLFAKIGMRDLLCISRCGL